MRPDCRNRYLLFALIVLVIVFLDQVSKGLIISYFHLYETKEVISGFFNITHVRNPGAAFGLFAASPSWFRTALLIVVTCGAIILILYYLISAMNTGRAFTFALALICSGAVGNLIDRIRFGEVVDFLDFYIGHYHWPAFNVADGAITVGAVVLCLEMIKDNKNKQRSAA